MAKTQWPIISDEMKKAVLKVLEGDFHPPGVQTDAFENEFAKFCGAKHAVAVSSGTAALHLSSLACGIRPGDEVITTSNSMSSSVDCILFVGARPVLVDIEEETFNIDPDKIEEKIKKKTKAILPVHLNGHPSEMDTIMDIAESHDLVVYDDACHSAGSKYKEKRLGNINDITSFSFVSKNITVGGDGGMVVTNNEELAESVRMLRRHGRNRKGEHVRLGYNYRMSEVAATIGRFQLKELDHWNDIRRRNAKLYSDLLQDTPIRCPVEKSWAHHVYLFYFIESTNRDDLKLFLNEKGIRVRTPYQPIHTLPYYVEKFGESKGELPQTEKHYMRALALPIYPTMGKADVEQVAENITNFYLK